MKTQDKATLKLNFNDKNEWWMAKGMEPAKGPNDYPKLKVDFDHEGLFTFRIQNPQDVTFATTDPFVPKSAKNTLTDFHDQFTFEGQGTRTLTVKDANASKNGGPYAGGDYHYELRFSDGTTLDPIITNTGCCRAMSESNLVFYSLGAVALLALIILIVRPILARRSAGRLDR